MYLKIFLSAYGLFNLYTFFLMGWDKSRALKKEYRISEKRFYELSVFGGSLGVLLGIPFWRHKNQKWDFKKMIYGIAVAQILLFIFIMRFVF
jgi:uncharacterized membrane protein YsdA (DUF1294 family)